MRVGTPRGAVAAADFAGDDGGAQRLFCAPVKCRAYCYADLYEQLASYPQSLSAYGQACRHPHSA